MKDILYAAPEAFSRAPMVAILPVRGHVGRLDALTPSLYARYERVVNAQRSLAQQEDTGFSRRLAAEESMLRTVLEWLSVEPDRGGVVTE
jgi:hypothetical protein